MCHKKEKVEEATEVGQSWDHAARERQGDSRIYSFLSRLSETPKRYYRVDPIRRQSALAARITSPERQPCLEHTSER